MKNSIKYIAALLIAFLSVQAGSAQQSDYQIKEEFEASYAAIIQGIEASSSIADIDSLIGGIERFRSRFINHYKMLDYALYPESFDSKIATLKSNARSTEHKLLIIENQAERLSLLSDEVTRFKSELAKLNLKSDSLRKAIAMSEESERKLSELVTRYRKSVEQRDQFIFDMIDSLLITYDSIVPGSINELAKNRAKTVSSEENPLVIINSMLTENIESAKAKSNVLTTEDYLRIYALQHKVQNVWNNIGDKLLAIYGGNDKSRWNQQISSNLRDWKASASLSMWNSLDSFLEIKNVDIGAFDNNSSFFTALDNFVTEATKGSNGAILGNNTYEDFKTFSEFWTTKVLDDWNEYIVEADVLTTSQIASIDSKIDAWGDASKPLSLGIVFLIGFGILAFIVLIVALIMK